MNNIREVDTAAEMSPKGNSRGKNKGADFTSLGKRVNDLYYYDEADQINLLETNSLQGANKTQVTGIHFDEGSQESNILTQGSENVIKVYEMWKQNPNLTMDPSQLNHSIGR